MRASSQTYVERGVEGTLSSETQDIVAEPVSRFDCPQCDQTIVVEGLQPFSDVECSGCGSKFKVPMKLGQFLLFDLLGKGGMGAVYRGLDISLKRYVAIKVMQKALGDDPQFVKDFLREARAAAQFNHRNVAQIYSFGEEDGQPVLAMELVEGGSLEDLVHAKADQDEVRMLDVAIDVAEALKAANKIGLRHGDIKPANILFSAKGVAKVVDFGLAWFAESQQKPGEIWGTPYYIAPEKVTRAPADHRADIYSFGATFFHALTGRAPFEGATAKDVVVKRLKEPAPNIRDLRPKVSRVTAEWIERTLQKEPDKRHPTYTSLISDLHKARSAALQAGDESAAERLAAAGAGGKKKRLPVVLLVATLLVGGGVALWNHLQSDQTSQKPDRYDLIDGKLVPVYTGQGKGSKAPTSVAQPGSQQGKKTTSAATTTEAPGTLTKLSEMMRQAATGDSFGAAISVQKLYRKLAGTDVNKSVVRMAQAFLAYVEGDASTGGTILADLRKNGAPNGQLVAQVLVDNKPVADVRKAAGNASLAEQQLVVLAGGLRLLMDGDLEAGAKMLNEFGIVSEKTTWASEFKPMAAKWESQIASWQTLEGKLDAWSASEAETRLREFRKDAPWFLQKLSRIAEKERVQRRPPKPSKPPPAPPKTVEVDAATVLKGLMERNQPLLDRKRFDEALANLTAVSDQVKGKPEASDMDRLSDGYQRLQEVHEFLVSQVAARPSPKPVPELGGIIKGATPEGLQVVASESEKVTPWGEVSTTLYLRMLDYYVKSADLSSAEKANYFLSIAVYCYEGGGKPRSAFYAKKAMELDAGLADEARKLLPTLNL